MEPTLTKNGMNELNKNLIISKQLANPNDPNILNIIQKYVDEIDRQIGSSRLVKSTIKIHDSVTNQQNLVDIKKDEVKSLIQKYVDQAYH